MAKIHEEKASSSDQIEKVGEKAAALVAHEDTPTIYGRTLGQLVADLKRENDQAVMRAVEAEESLAKAAVKIAALKANGGGFEKLPDGGVKFVLVLDVDQATPLLSWAEGAEEDPATYIPRQVAEALQAFGNYAGEPNAAVAK